jgi:hypothetical protein
MVVTGCAMGAGAGGGGATFFASLVLNIRNILARASFVVRVASACSDSHLSISWNLSMSIAMGLTVFEFLEGDTGGSEWQ